MTLIFFLIALVYSTVGFAGGSSYLFFLTLAGVPRAESVPLVLICNLAVSTVSFFHFYRAGHFRFRKVLPFMLLSIPMAFLGACIPTRKEIFFLLLGVCLACAGLRLFLFKEMTASKPAPNSKKLWFLGIPAGALMGFFSGLVGIGGGIFLSPFLFLTGLGTLSEASAAASFFIFVNSLSGLIGKMQNGFVIGPHGWSLVISALCGGWMGSRLGCNRFPRIGLQRILAVLTLFISTGLILKAF